jgi:phosphatidylglycerophosphatase A
MTRLVATVFGVGLFPFAPGTLASLLAVLIGLLIWRVAGFPGLLVATLAVTLLGFWACEQEIIHDEDPAEVVIDEVAGQWLTLLFPAAAFWMQGWQDWLPWPAAVAAFVLFRLFDIWKPGPIGWVDRRATPAAVMLDDLAAAVAAGLVTLAAGAIWHAVLMI